jgi:hypothetical protein
LQTAVSAFVGSCDYANANADADANADSDAADAHCDGDDGDRDSYIKAVSDDGATGSQPEAPTASLRKKGRPKGARADRDQPVHRQSDGGRCPVGTPRASDVMIIKHPGNPKSVCCIPIAILLQDEIAGSEMRRHKPGIIQIYTWHMARDSESLNQVYTRYIQISGIYHVHPILKTW